MMYANPTILTFVGHYLPGYKSGGPVRTISNMVDHLGDEFDFRIVTKDRDFLETQPYPDIQVDSWNTVGKAKVYYASPDNLSLEAIARLIRETPHDILYLNSFFSKSFTIKPLTARRLCMFSSKPVVLAPRGEFSQGALGLKSLKKQLYIRLAKPIGLYKNLKWQASSEHEKSDIQKGLGITDKNIFVAPNLPPPVFNGKITPKPKSDDALQIVFLSRISPMKNLDFALRVLARVKVPAKFNLYGLVDDLAYWTRCQELIDDLPENIQVKYWGAVPHAQVQQILSEHDLFFLPTRGENYGHAIFEALAAGSPALISDQTPWRDFDSAGVGWVLPLNDPQAYVRVIESFATMNPDKKATMHRAAVQYAANVSGSEDNIAANRELFMKAVQV